MQFRMNLKILVPATSANLGPGFDCLGLSLKLLMKLKSKNQVFLALVLEAREVIIFFLKNNIFVNIFMKFMKN